eukprot:scaffold3692_cov178-Chaetoceros_neogracile.AAC.5
MGGEPLDYHHLEKAASTTTRWACPSPICWCLRPTTWRLGLRGIFGFLLGSNCRRSVMYMGSLRRAISLRWWSRRRKSESSR